MSIDTQTFKALFPDIAGHCDKDSLDALLQAMTEQSVSAGETVIKEGEHTANLYMVVSGDLVTSIDSDAGSAEISTVSAGDTFCKVNLLDPGPATMTVTATTDATLLLLSHDAFRQLENAHLQMSGNILRMLSDELVELCRSADKVLFNRSAGIETSEQNKHAGLKDWALHVFRQLHG